MKYAPLMAALALAVAATPAAAQDQDIEIAEDKLLVLACLENLENTTTWSQCVNLMFQPCIDETPGSETHAACLGEERAEWAGTVETLQNVVIEAVAPQSKAEVVDLMGLWTTYVVQKCNDVATSKPTGAESARLGCEVSELAGLSAEFAACLEGRSTADYCTLKEN